MNNILNIALLFFGALSLITFAGFCFGVCIYLISIFVWYYLAFIFGLVALALISMFVSLVFLYGAINAPISEF